MLSAAIRCCLALVLVVACVLKLARPSSTQSALATFGLSGLRLRWCAWGTIVCAELALAIGIVLGLVPAAYVAAALMLAFAAAMAIALIRGHGEAPCACFGARSRIGKPGIARNLLLAAGFAAIPSLPGAEPTTEQWLTLWLLIAPLAIVGLSVTLLVSARGGLLRLERAPRGALEIPEEGPQLRRRTDLIERFRIRRGAKFALAVFTREGCHACRRVVPALEALARDPLVELVVFEEHSDSAVFRKLEIPGSPFAVVLDSEGTVLSKGTFNTHRQLESILATAERRLHEAEPKRSVPEAPLAESITEGTSRRGFLARAGGALIAATFSGIVAAVLKPGDADAFHFCGHTFTTGSCSHPTGLPRVDARGFPVRSWDDARIDDLGRLIDPEGRPVDEQGRLLVDPDGRPLPLATRTRLCKGNGERYGFRTWTDGSWHRCCGGHVRKLMDCCAYRSTRINGDAALSGYCYSGRKVFCVMYYQTKIPC